MYVQSHAGHNNRVRPRSTAYTKFILGYIYYDERYKITATPVN